MRYPYNGQRQIEVLPPIVLATMTGAGGGGTIEFRVQTPDSRLQVKVSVLFAPTPPFSVPYDITNMGATIYLAEEDESYGATYSGYVPMTAIINGATLTSPLSLPQAPGLMGYSQEFVTAADAIHGFLGLSPAGEGSQGQWVLQVRYQPYGQRLPEADWSETKTLCNATRIGPAGSF